jgi:histidine triad (HIT) family protein
MPSRNNCIFCLIASKDIPCQSVYEDDDVLAFKDLKPQAPIHVLIIPKEHYANLSSFEPDDSALLGKLMLAASAIAEQMEIAETGYRVVTNTGMDGGQSVSHLHLHLLGGRQMTWPPG